MLTTSCKVAKFMRGDFARIQPSPSQKAMNFSSFLTLWWIVFAFTFTVQKQIPHTSEAKQAAILPLVMNFHVVVCIVHVVVPVVFQFSNEIIVLGVSGDNWQCAPKCQFIQNSLCGFSGVIEPSCPRHASVLQC